jgi:hypothetical protein
MCLMNVLGMLRDKGENSYNHLLGRHGSHAGLSSWLRRRCARRILRQIGATHVHALVIRCGHGAGPPMPAGKVKPLATLPRQLGGIMHSHTPLISGVRRLLAAGILTVALGAPSPAPAQQATAPAVAAVDAAPAPFLPPYVGATLERYFDRLRVEFKQLDGNFDGKITPSDIEVHVLMETVQQRTYALLFVLRYDLNNDGVVTEDEVLQAMRYEVRSNPTVPQKYIGDRVRSIMDLDTDKDGKVSVAEASKFRDPELQRGFELGSPSSRTRKALTLESSTKGEIALQDYVAAGEALFRKVDADRDGKISPQEFDDYRKVR